MMLGLSQSRSAHIKFMNMITGLITRSRGSAHGTGDDYNEP